MMYNEIFIQPVSKQIMTLDPMEVFQFTDFDVAHSPDGTMSTVTVTQPDGTTLILEAPFVWLTTILDEEMMMQELI
jgi:hypothetical protein